MLLNMSCLTTLSPVNADDAFPNVMLITHGRRARDSKNPEPRGMLDPVSEMDAPAHRQVTGILRRMQSACSIWLRCALQSWQASSEDRNYLTRQRGRQ
jgi:hypothetical protein